MKLVNLKLKLNESGHFTILFWIAQ